MYYEGAEGVVPAVQGMARTHEGVLKVPPLLKLPVRFFLIIIGGVRVQLLDFQKCGAADYE